MYGYIYLTTNLINDRKYIGKHKSETFDKSYLGSGKILKQAFESYGRENFKCEILEPIDVNTICETLEELNNAEQYYIKYFDCINSHEYYNIASGGDGGKLASMRWYTNGEINLHLKVGEPIPDGFKIGRSNIDYLLNAERPSNKGEKNAMYGKKGELSPNYGKKASPEVRQKMSDAWNYEKHITQRVREAAKENIHKMYEEKTGLYSEESKRKAYETHKLHGFALSETTKQKIKEKAKKCPVICIETGIIYESTKEAERLTGTNHSSISRSCKDPNAYTTTSWDDSPINNKIHYHWKYIEKEEIKKC